MGIVGRAGEYAAIVGMLTEPEQALVVTGASGIGKSALFDAVSKSGVHNLSVKATAHESRWPLAGLHMILDQILTPGLAEILMPAVSTDVPPTNFAVATRIAATLRESELPPTLLLIDDAEYLDEDSKQVIGSIIRRLRGTNIRMVLGMEANDSHGPFVGIREIRLRPLSFRRATMAAKELAPEGSDLGALRMVAYFSSGSPSTIADMLAAMSQNTLNGTDPLPLPMYAGKTSANNALEPLQLLSDTAKLQLQMLSCAYKTPLDAIQWLFPDGTTDLEMLIAHGFIRVSAALLHIQSPQLRSVIYGSMTPNQRTSTHARLSEALRMSHYPLHLWHESFVNPTADLAAQLKKTSLELFARGAIQVGVESLERGRSLSKGDADDWLLFQNITTTLMNQGELSLASRYQQAMLRTGPLVLNPTQVLLSLRLNFLVAGTVDVAQCEVVARSHGSTHPPEVSYVFATAAYYLAEIGELDTAKTLLERAVSMDNTIGSRSRAMCTVVEYLLSTPGTPLSRKPEDIQVFLREIAVLGPNNSRILLARVLTAAEEYDAAGALLDTVIARGAHTNILEKCVARLSKVDNEYRSGDHHSAMAVAKRLVGMDLDPYLMSQANAIVRVWFYGFVGENICQDLAIKSLQSLAKPQNGQIINARFLAILGRTYLDQGRFAEGLTHLLRGCELSASWPHPEDLRLAPDLVEAYVALNQPRKARKVLEHFEQGVVTHPTRWSQVVLARCHALLLEGQPSLDAFQEVEDSWRVGDSEYERSRTLRAHTRRLHELGEYGTAILNASAHSSAMQPPTSGEVSHVEIVEPVDRRTMLLKTLSDPQREVVVLALDGLKNREIADEVHLTLRGVESRLSAAYERLGVGNRSQLFAEFSEVDPLPRSAGRRPQREAYSTSFD